MSMSCEMWDVQAGLGVVKGHLTLTFIDYSHPSGVLPRAPSSNSFVSSVMSCFGLKIYMYSC